jgi:hypothetical protein
VYSPEIPEQSATIHVELPGENGRAKLEDVEARVEIFVSWTSLVCPAPACYP